jgi:hypothetical protein
MIFLYNRRGDPSIRKRWMSRSGRFGGLDDPLFLGKYFLRWMIPSFSIYNQTHAKKEYHPILFILDKVSLKSF